MVRPNCHAMLHKRVPPLSQQAYEPEHEVMSTQIKVVMDNQRSW